MNSAELGQLVDAYNLARSKRLYAQKLVDQQEEAEKSLKDKLIAAFKESNTTACGGRTAIIKLVTKNEPTCEDIDKLYAHIRATGEFELLYRRINPKSIKERWDAGVAVPGIAFYPVETLSISQIKE